MECTYISCGVRKSLGSCSSVEQRMEGEAVDRLSTQDLMLLSVRALVPLFAGECERMSQS